MLPEVKFQELEITRHTGTEISNAPTYQSGLRRGDSTPPSTLSKELQLAFDFRRNCLF